MFRFRILSIVILYFCSFHQVTAQEAKREEAEKRAIETILELEKGVLILRLPSEAKKIKAMQDLLDSNIKAADRDRLAKQIESVQQKSREENASIAAAFDSLFTFVPVYVIYDTATTALLDGRSGNYLLDAKLKPVAVEKISNKPFLIARIGKTDQSSTTGAEAIVLMDRQLQDLEAPFPFAVKLNSLGYALNQLLIPGEAFSKRIAKVVIRLNKNLIKFSTGVKE